MTSQSQDVTQLLDAWTQGDATALDRLIPLVVDDLRRMAGRRLALERAGHTLQPTALVNELYLKLVGMRSVRWESRTQFFASMAEVMRRILVDHSRRRKALKKGSGAVCITFSKALDVAAPRAGTELDVLAVDEALERLAAIAPRQARIVELRYFAGLTLDETAQTLDVSTMTVKREWRTARLWLLREMGGLGGS